MCLISRKQQVYSSLSGEGRSSNRTWYVFLFKMNAMIMDLCLLF